MPGTNPTLSQLEKIVGDSKIKDIKLNEVFDSLAEDCGEVITEDTEVIEVTDKKKISDAINRQENKFAYDDRNIPMPGQEMDDKLFRDLTNSDKDTGVKRLLAEAAILKAESEREAEKEQSAKKFVPSKEQKEELIKQILYDQERMYFEKYKYMMSGKQRRTLRKKIEKNFDKGRYNKFLIQDDGIPLN